MRKLFPILLTIAYCLMPVASFGAQYIDDRIIPPGVTRDAEIIPTGEANGICVSNTGTTAPAITLCSTLDLTGKTLLFKLPEYTVATLPASHPLAIVTDGTGSTDCTAGGGATRVMCHWNGSAWASIGGGGGVGDPGANGIAVRSAVNTLIARTLTGTPNRVVITDGSGVAGPPTFNTGSDVAHKSEANTFSGANNFTATLRVPRKVTPGDLGTLSDGEVFIDGELVKYKSNTGVVYTLFKVGDAITRTFIAATNPIETDDTADGYVAGDIWINQTGGSIWQALSVAAGAAVWKNLSESGVDVAASFEWTGQHTNAKTIGTLTNAGPFPGGHCTTNGFHGVDTTNGEPYFCKDGAAGNTTPFSELGDTLASFNDGANAANLSGADSARFAGTDGVRMTVWHGTGTFTNQPANDGVEVVSSAAGDTTQTLQLCGTTSGGDERDVTCETITLNGVTQVATTKTNWNNLLTAALSAATTGNVTIREASGNATIVTIAAGDTRAANLATVMGSVDSSSPLKTKSITFRIGSDTGSALVDTQDEANIWPNNIAAMTITEIKAWTDQGTSTINIERDDGSAANICSSDLVATTSGVTCTLAGAEDNLAVGDKLNFKMVTAATSGTPKRITVSIKAVLD